LINHKTVFGTRNPAFWVGAVCALNDEYSSFIRMPESESLLVGEVAPKT